MKKYIALTIAVVILAGGAFVSQQWFIQTFSTAENQTATVTFTVDSEGTVLETMNARAVEGELSFSGRDFPGLGFFVEEINGKRNANGFYWILRINGELSDRGVSQAVVSSGDLVEWRYEKGY
ncbi:DUF4430 domain-containing protein [Candidatus Kaiserbacteria bacterium]|nr:DUF4430 domain-containing protein [Candidatus Kaiserbacteria bacterium]